MSLIDEIAKAVREFKAEPPKTPQDSTDHHDFVISEYIHRVKQDAETAQWLLKHPEDRTTN